MYLITGATGNTGSVIAERLLKAGQKVRVVGRDPKRLEKFTEKVRNHSSVMRPMRALSRRRLPAQRPCTR